MFRNSFHRSRFLLGLALPFVDHDKVSKDSKTAQSFYTDASNDETGWDRIHMMFSVAEFGTVSPELNAVYQASFLGMFTGACIGGIIRSRTAYLNFMDSNKATVYTSHLEAKKKLQDAVTISFGKGAFQWGWRLALFSGSYVLITTAVSVYRGRSSLLEYVVAGGLTGACYKVNLGARGVLVGGALGVGLGAVAGALSLGALALSGTSMEEVRFWQYRWKTARQSQTQKAYKKSQEADEDALVKSHNEKVGAIANDLTSVDLPAAT